MSKKKGKLIIFTGPSGVGKGTILNDFFSKINEDSKKVVYSISSTTRLPRVGEINGVHYSFISKEKFLDLINQDAFLEWAEYSGNYYGTNKKFVEEKLNEGLSVLLEIELQGALKVMEKCPDAIKIFITPPNFEELERRLRGRHSEDEATILKRLERAKEELKNTNKFTYIIENDIVKNAVNTMIEIYNNEISK